METRIFKDDITPAAGIIQGGGLVAVPTETVYGLAANGLDEAAVENLYAVKGRPTAKPLSLMVPDRSGLEKYGRCIPRGAYVLAEAFWPGPLTIVVEAGEDIPSVVTAGGHTVGLRCPDSEKTLSLLRSCGLPLAAPSANPSGQPSPKTAEQVLDYFSGRIDGIIDGGPCGIGRESTVIDLTVTPYQILRQGALLEKDIERALIESLKVVGITGGTGAGKTTALDALRDMGALVIDADKVYYDLCESCAPMLEQINARFPGAVENGFLQRKKLGSVAFSDPQALGDLRSITDRYVVSTIDHMLACHAAAGGRYGAVDAINILDTGLRDDCVATVGVLAPAELRITRLMEREGISAEYAAQRIRAQRPDSYYTENCTHILRNDGSRKDFRRACDELFKRILEES
ncbi:MAG: threonylcarbamoyl-AMP synthase [Oscillospiraceae bacterium]|nr:threonylcarbamoyl-AMP synthase [Oscillospiraceae bacterium]